MPIPPPLPTIRVKEALAFSFTGVDFVGPLARLGKIKVWICLYTCLVMRAVHLDIVGDMSTETFVKDLLPREDCQKDSSQTMARRLRPPRSFEVCIQE